MSERVMLTKQASDLVTLLARDRNVPLSRMADRAIGMAGFIDREIKKGSEILIKHADGSMIRILDI